MVFFTQIPFVVYLTDLSVDESIVTAAARVSPVLISSAVLSEALERYSFPEYYVSQDGEGDAVSWLNAGASRVVADVAAEGVDPARFLVRGATFHASGTPESGFLLAPDAAAVAACLSTQAIPVIPAALFAGQLSVGELFASRLGSDRPDGLFPTVPVSVASVDVALGLAYASAEAVRESIETGAAVYYSRSRKGLWRKGATSGAQQRIVSVRADCDWDALEYRVEETGESGVRDGFCHVPGQKSCFGGATGLSELTATLAERRASAPAGSYTARLFAEPKLLQAKILEEAQELCDAKSTSDVASECADLLYFALARCTAAGVSLRAVSDVLDARALKVSRRKGDAKEKYAKALGLTSAQAKGVEPGTSESAIAGSAANGNPPPQKKARVEGGESGEVASDAVTATPPPIKCQTFTLADLTPSEHAKLLRRPIQKSADMNAKVQPILDTVKSGGDAGLRGLVAKLDRCPLDGQDLVMKAPFAASDMHVDADVKAAIDQAYANIKAFHGAQMDKERTTLRVETMPGVVCSRFARPIERIGVYVPGGTAILPSTALMLATPAQVAGCASITLATPPRPDGSISPEIVYIASLTGVQTIVRAGGAHAIAALAYGTESVPKVDKILGPGNTWVTAAKMMVSMDSDACVAIDMPAGPSEVLVIADETGNPDFVASDLLAQAEHGVDSQVVLLTVGLSDERIAAIEAAINAQALALPRVAIIRESIAHSLLVKCASVDAAFEFSNAYAPEHLILHLKDAPETLPRVQNAGSVFVGGFTPESCGDYASGTNHTLPTYGYARQYSGVSTLSYLKHITSQEITPDGLRRLGPVVECLAETEVLHGHKNAVTVRLEAVGRV